MMNQEKKDVLRRVISDAIRFGAAIGSWYDSKQIWHQCAGNDCCTAIEKYAISEIADEFRLIDEQRCRLCDQLKPKKDEDEKE